jgi:hypothetical protein
LQDSWVAMVIAVFDGRSLKLLNQTKQLRRGASLAPPPMGLVGNIEFDDVMGFNDFRKIHERIACALH